MASFLFIFNLFKQLYRIKSVDFKKIRNWSRRRLDQLMGPKFVFIGLVVLVASNLKRVTELLPVVFILEILSSQNFITYQTFQLGPFEFFELVLLYICPIFIFKYA